MDILNIYLPTWHQRRNYHEKSTDIDIHPSSHLIEWYLDQALRESIYRDDVFTVEIIRDHTLAVEKARFIKRKNASGKNASEMPLAAGTFLFTATEQSKDRTEANHQWFNRFCRVYRNCQQERLSNDFCTKSDTLASLSTPQIAMASYYYTTGTPPLLFPSPEPDKHLFDLFDLYDQDNMTQKSLWVSLVSNYCDLFHTLSVYVFADRDYQEDMTLKISRQFYELYVTGFFTTTSTPLNDTLSFTMNGLRHVWLLLYASTDPSMSLSAILDKQLKELETSSDNCQENPQIEDYIRGVLPLYVRFFVYTCPETYHEHVFDVKELFYGDRLPNIRQKLYHDLQFFLHDLPHRILAIRPTTTAAQLSEEEKYENPQKQQLENLCWTGNNDAYTHYKSSSDYHILCHHLLHLAHRLYNCLGTLLYDETKIQLTNNHIKTLQKEYKPPTIRRP